MKGHNYDLTPIGTMTERKDPLIQIAL